jgi:hypothetical protein
MRSYAQECLMPKLAVYNPLEKPEKDLPVIYGFCDRVVTPTDLVGILMGYDGKLLGSHVCSNESFMMDDLGIWEGTRPDRHETFRKHYPDGYRMEFVSGDSVGSHGSLQTAILKNRNLYGPK